MFATSMRSRVGCHVVDPGQQVRKRADAIGIEHPDRPEPSAGRHSGDPCPVEMGRGYAGDVGSVPVLVQDVAQRVT